MFRSKFGLGLCLVFGFAGSGFANEPASSRWAEFRNGGTSHTAASLPSTWSPEATAWQLELRGYGQSTPVIQNQRVFVTSVVGPMKDECVVSCYDLQSGQEVWSYQHPASEKAASNYMASRAAPTPVVDDHAVYAFFESGDCLAVDHTGKLLWHRSLTKDLGKFDNNHGLGASPTQTDDLVIINIEHRGPSYLIALSKSSGSTQWQVDRKSSSSWSSPIVVRHHDSQQVIVSSGGTVDGFDVKSGQQLWSLGGLDGNSVPSPTPDGSNVLVGARVPEFASDGEAAKSNLCIDLSDLSGTGKTPSIAWRASKAISDYASPVVSQGCVYYLNKIGVLYCLDQQTGQAHYTERLGTQCWATPIVSGDYIYFFGKDGKTQIVRSGPTFELIHSNLLWDPANPPKPESYVENNSRPERSNSGPAEESQPAEGQANAEAKPAKEGQGGREGRERGGRGGGMLAALQNADKDGDGNLSGDEIPAELKPMIARIDTNSDGVIDQAERQAMVESFAARRADSREGARDPIVYGAAAVDNTLIVRTGTRLYCIRQ